MSIKIKRVYESPANSDGFRILVDRLWPRGLTKSEAKINLWLKEIAPSNELRKWFNHDSEKWLVFNKKYQKELESKFELIGMVNQLEKENGAISLLYSAKNEKNNNAVALKMIISSLRNTAII